MDMVIHQAKCMGMVAKPLDSFLGKKVKSSPILIIIENDLPSVAPQDNVMQCSRIMDSWLPRHSLRLSNKLHYCRPDPILFFSINQKRKGYLNYDEIDDLVPFNIVFLKDR
jgi:hypothetical protein